MSNTTDEYWEINGVSLQTYAWNITTWGGSRQSPPGLRGSNVAVPGAPGALFAEKVLDSRTITLSMFVQGSDVDGNITGDSTAVFEKNWRMLRKLLFPSGRKQVTLTKRFLDDDGVLRTATGKGQFAGGLQPSMTGRNRAVFTVDILMADPFFYGDPIALETSSTQQKTWQVDVAGDWGTNKILVHIEGAREKPQIVVTNEDDETITVQYSDLINAGESVDIDVQDFDSTTNGADGVFKSGGYIAHAGDEFWLRLEPGNNTVVLTSTSGSGPVTLTYTPVWF